MLLTSHEPKVINSGKGNFFTGFTKLKPEVIVDYNKKMGSVYTVDMVLSTMRVAEKL
jgi:hypothetical protein